MVTSKRLSTKRIAEMRNIAPVKTPLSIRIDSDVLSWFKSQGKGYQTRINKALRDVMTQSKRR